MLRQINEIRFALNKQTKYFRYYHIEVKLKKKKRSKTVSLEFELQNTFVFLAKRIF